MFFEFFFGGFVSAHLYFLCMGCLYLVFWPGVEVLYTGLSLFLGMEYDLVSKVAHVGRFSGLATTLAGFAAGNNATLYMVGGVLMASGIALEAGYHVLEEDIWA